MLLAWSSRTKRGAILQITTVFYPQKQRKYKNNFEIPSSLSQSDEQRLQGRRHEAAEVVEETLRARQSADLEIGTFKSKKQPHRIMK